VKRSPIKRKSQLKPSKKPMKRKPIRKKRKKKGTPGWYKQKVYRMVMDEFKGQPCAICGTTEGTAGHHILPKGSTPYHIATRENLIPLCQNHHRYNREICPHSSDPFVVDAFLLWLMDNRPDQYDWTVEHRRDTAAKCGKIDWRARYEELGNDL